MRKGNAKYVKTDTFYSKHTVYCHSRYIKSITISLLFKKLSIKIKFVMLLSIILLIIHKQITIKII